MNYKSALIASTAFASAVFAAMPAMAQVTPAEETAMPADEIVVTARKRAESTMNVPVVVTALSGESLQRMNLSDIRSLATQVPGLSLGVSVLAVGTQVSLRGVGTSALDPGVDASVSLVIDGQALTQGLAYAAGLFDLADVQVYKGPQALFYGKSSPAGVIALRTADPTDKFEAIARAGYEFEARERRFDAIVSGPLAEGFKARLAAQYGKQDGFFKNNAVAIPGTGARTPSSNRLTGGDDYKVRLTLLANPSDAFDARIKLNHAHDNIVRNATGQNVLCPDGTGPYDKDGPGPAAATQFINPDCKLDRNAPLVDLDPAAFPNAYNNGTPVTRFTQNFGTAELNFHLQPQLTLTSQTSYYEVKAKAFLNATMSSAAAGFIGANNLFKRDQLTEELRLVSDFDGALNFTAGGYLERGAFSDDILIMGNTTPTATYSAPAVVQKGKTSVKVRTESVFGQLTYKITPEFEFAGGARWTNERRSQTVVMTNTGVAVPVTVLTPKIQSRNVSPEVSLTYRPSPNLTIFGDVKQAYKSGSFNVSTPPTATTENSFGDERVRGGEIGIKSRSDDRRLTFEAAGYYYKYRGLQVGANVTTLAGVSQTRTINAGQGRVYGLEASASYRPEGIDGLNLRAAVNYNDSKYTDLVGVPCYGGQTIAQGCNILPRNAALPAATYGVITPVGVPPAVDNGFTGQVRSGIPFLRSPKWQGNVGFDYTMEVGNGLSLVFANSNQFFGRNLTNLAFDYYQKAYIKMDASIALKGENWELQLVGKNLNNEITSANCTNSARATGQTSGRNQYGYLTGSANVGAAGTDEIGCYADRGRELWVRATLRY